MSKAEMAYTALVAAEEHAEPPSCDVFAQMLTRVYYIRDQLDKTTTNLASLGYKTGEEWEMDQGIGNVTPATLANVVCPLLANHTSQFAANIAQIANDTSLLAMQADPVKQAANTTDEPTEEPGLVESVGSATWDWLSGGSAPKPTQEPAASEAATTQSPSAPEGVSSPRPLVPAAADSMPSPAPAPTIPNNAAPMDAGCPAGSLQRTLLTKLNGSFDGIKSDRGALNDVRRIFEDLVLSIENGVMALYGYRGCPKVTEQELKKQHVCEVNQAKQASALRMHQSSIPEMRSRLFALRSRIREIDSGKPTECYFAQRGRTASHKSKELGWCLELHAVIDSLLDGRTAQKQWLKDMGDGIKNIGTMAMQLNRQIQDPVLKRDKIPRNALGAMTKSWKDLLSPIQQLGTMGGLRASQGRNLDGVVLQLSGFLRNVSTEHHCITDGFQMRYSAQDCASLQVQLNAAAQARQTDLEALQQRAQTMMLTASNELVKNKCTSAPMAQGCWLRMPTGCPNLPNWKSANQWTRDSFGEESTGAGIDQGVCTVSRKLQMDNLCGVANTEMRFIPPAASSQEQP